MAQRQYFLDAKSALERTTAEAQQKVQEVKDQEQKLAQNRAQLETLNIKKFDQAFALSIISLYEYGIEEKSEPNRDISALKTNINQLKDQQRSSFFKDDEHIEILRAALLLIFIKLSKMNERSGEESELLKLTTDHLNRLCIRKPLNKSHTKKVADRDCVYFICPITGENLVKPSEYDDPRGYAYTSIATPSGYIVDKYAYGVLRQKYQEEPLLPITLMNQQDLPMGYKDAICGQALYGWLISMFITVGIPGVFMMSAAFSESPSVAHALVDGPIGQWTWLTLYNMHNPFLHNAMMALFNVAASSGVGIALGALYGTYYCWKIYSAVNAFQAKLAEPNKVTADGEQKSPHNDSSKGRPSGVDSASLSTTASRLFPKQNGYSFSLCFHDKSLEQNVSEELTSYAQSRVVAVG